MQQAIEEEMAGFEWPMETWAVQDDLDLTVAW
jgi:hypothetical protein